MIVRLPPPISVNNLFATVGRRRVPTSRYKAWQATADAMLREQCPRQIAGPVHVTLRVGAKGVRSNSDTDNVSKAYLDALVRCGVLVDDSRLHIPRLTIEWVDGVAGCEAVMEAAE
jgi:Holliday junction resolvase RusA-like endonuclease